MNALDRADALWSALDEALDDSTDHCARCKTCAVQTAAVFTAIHEAGYVLVQAPSGRPMTASDAQSAQLLADFRERHAHPPLLDCGLVAHRDLGFCSACHKHGSSGEVTGWRLLAMAERGIPDQPSREGLAVHSPATQEKADAKSRPPRSSSRTCSGPES